MPRHRACVLGTPPKCKSENRTWESGRGPGRLSTQVAPSPASTAWGGSSAAPTIPVLPLYLSPRSRPLLPPRPGAEALLPNWGPEKTIPVSPSYLFHPTSTYLIVLILILPSPPSNGGHGRAGLWLGTMGQELGPGGRGSGGVRLGTRGAPWDARGRLCDVPVASLM